ncbi:phosphotransferase family enzyme [Paenibacillus taihuensis]|uniref:Phosphotransferase family enzyme n=1 Tax=Paenibacillus taihuensis TaxID=1156355 RepID=A0A3D9S1V3_9BACL|nr:phosphotransferase [Paenibacillus taihuensis]REE83854.1 phosphotransferase family enzyme [Paenibacillus taihuensis]
MLQVQVEGRTGLPIEGKLEQLNRCLEQIFGHDGVELLSVVCEDLVSGSLNPTTAGIYRVHGLAHVRGEEKSWSLVLKVSKADSDDKLKDDIQHHNYWLREALLFESGLLDELPESILRAPRSYLVEEQADGTAWLWMEHVDGYYPRTKEQLVHVAHQLGRFGGEYLMGRSGLPSETWICRSWLKSWIVGSRQYAPDPHPYVDQLQKENERSIWAWFQQLEREEEQLLASLQRLPRVLAHQDLGHKNILLVQDPQGAEQVVFIDWQFMSISGVGEDLAKMFGVNMSNGVIPLGHYREYREALFDSYIAGLRAAGWDGDAALARFGFCAAAAFRSVWEVPRYLAWATQLEENPQDEQLIQRMERLEQVIAIHMEMWAEAQAKALI